MKKKITIALSIIIGASWIFNISYYYMSRLKAPIFIENLKEIEVQEILPTDVSFDDFTLFYITNIDDKDSIDEIRFPEMNDLSMNACSEVIKTYNNYNLMGITINPRMSSTIDCRKMLLSEVEKGKNKVTKMNCYTNLGKAYEVNLGEIYFTKVFYNTMKDPICNWNGASSSSDGTGSNSYSILRNFYLTSIKSNIFSELDKVFEISVNGTEIGKMKFPHKFNKENGLDITYRMKSNYYKSLQGNINLKAEYGEIKQEIPMRLQMNSFVQTIQLNKQFIKAIKESGGQAHEIGVK